MIYKCTNKENSRNCNNNIQKLRCYVKDKAEDTNLQSQLVFKIQILSKTFYSSIDDNQ